MTSTSSLTERRKAETELRIATVAARLFAERGADETTAEEVAEVAGVSLRTFYRYFRTKEDAIWPMLAHGGARWREFLAATPRSTPVLDAVQHAAERAMTMPDSVAAESLETTRGLLRAARSDEALRAVWYRVNGDSEERLVPILSQLDDAPSDPVQLRLIAACATSAIRIALEQWASTEADAEGADGPATLAARLMGTLLTGLTSRSE